VEPQAQHLLQQQARRIRGRPVQHQLEHPHLKIT
jgi:hypothetical protein